MNGSIFIQLSREPTKVADCNKASDPCCSLLSELRCIVVDSTFRRRLKAELFSRAYGVSINI